MKVFWLLLCSVFTLAGVYALFAWIEMGSLLYAVLLGGCLLGLFFCGKQYEKEKSSQEQQQIEEGKRIAGLKNGIEGTITVSKWRFTASMLLSIAFAGALPLHEEVFSKMPLLQGGVGFWVLWSLVLYFGSVGAGHFPMLFQRAGAVWRINKEGVSGLNLCSIPWESIEGVELKEVHTKSVVHYFLVLEVENGWLNKEGRLEKIKGSLWDRMQRVLQSYKYAVGKIIPRKKEFRMLKIKSAVDCSKLEIALAGCNVWLNGEKSTPREFFGFCEEVQKRALRKGNI